MVHTIMGLGNITKEFFIDFDYSYAIQLKSIKNSFVILQNSIQITVTQTNTASPLDKQRAVSLPL